MNLSDKDAIIEYLNNKIEENKTSEELRGYGADSFDMGYICTIGEIIEDIKNMHGINMTKTEADKLKAQKI